MNISELKRARDGAGIILAGFVPPTAEYAALAEVISKLSTTKAVAVEDNLFTDLATSYAKTTKRVEKSVLCQMLVEATDHVCKDAGADAPDTPADAAAGTGAMADDDENTRGRTDRHNQQTAWWKPTPSVLKVGGRFFQ